MSSVSTSSLSESSEFLEYSQAQSSTASSGEREEVKRKVYMRKKDRTAIHNSFNGANGYKESSDSDTSPTSSTKCSSHSINSSSYGSCNSTLSSGASSSVAPSDSNSSYKSNSSDCSAYSSNISSDETEDQLRSTGPLKTAAQKLVEEELASENLFNSHYISLHDESHELQNNSGILGSAKTN